MVSFFEPSLNKIKQGLMDALGREYGPSVNVGSRSSLCESHYLMHNVRTFYLLADSRNRHTLAQK